MKNFLIKNAQKIFLGLIFFILFFVPFLWVTTIGGDDGHFYYFFPFEFFKNFSIENLYNDLGSFTPQQYMIPFSLLLILSKKLLFFLDTQQIFFGLNLSCGFLFFYLFLSLFEKDKNISAKMIAALFYSLSIFSYYTLWSGQLFSMYLIPIFPLVVYLFFKSVRENSAAYSIVGSLIMAFFSIVTLSLPWSIPLIIVILPLLIKLFLNNKKIFAKHFFIFITLFVLLNSYWLTNFILASSSGGQAATFTATDFRKQNISLVESVAAHNSVLYPFFNLFHKNIQIDYNWPKKDLYLNYLVKLLPLNILFLVAVILPVFLYKKTNKEDKNIHNLALLSWLIILFLYTANFGNWGLSLFIWLTNKIPGWVMFRNMYDKFGVALSFSYALLLFISLKVIFNNLKIKDLQKNIISFVLVLLILLNGYPLLFGKFYELPIWTTKNTYARIDNFNDDFYSLTNHIAKINTSSKFLWLPLNQAGYMIISDKYNDNYYYAGISLLKTLSNKNDYSGFLSFNNFSSEIQNYIVKKDYEKLFHLLGKLNIGYVILNKDINKELQNSYLYSSLVKSDLYNNQMSPNFLKGILGEKVEDFGDKYSLYKINDKYLSRILDFNNIEFKKINNNKYKIYLKGLKTRSPLVFSSYFNKYWNLFLQQNPTDSWCQTLEIYNENILQRHNITECQNNQQFFEGEEWSYLWKKPIFDDTHKLVNQYANQWTIDPEYIKQNFSRDYYKENPDGSIDVEMVLYFKPQSYFYLGLIISGITLITCLGYLGYDFLRRRKNVTE